MAKKSKKILFAASEAIPFIKTGGLGDVCGALPKYLRQTGNDVRMVLPKYRTLKLHREVKWVFPMGVQMGNAVIWCGVLETSFEGVPVYLIEHNGFFDRDGIYDNGKWEYPDNAARFGFFSRACIQLCRDIGFQPDIIHCHDWQTALIPAYLKTWEAADPFFRNTGTVFSIHNIGFQGTFSKDQYDFLGLGHENYTPEKFENYKGVNFMKGALYYSDCISTVSPTYAREILSDPGGNGISSYLNRRRDDLYGVLNGVDYDYWNPEKDPLIPERYSSADLSGKSICKRDLQREFWLHENLHVPVIGVVCRFTEQKGLHVLAKAIKAIVQNMVVQFVFSGKGEKWIEDFFGGLPAEYPGKIGAWIGHEERKTHLIAAGSDFFLMPSLYEPCGLGQVYSMRYGSLPIVRITGGLKDTVKQYDEKNGTGTGFCFYDASPEAIYYTVGWAVSTYYDRPKHYKAMQQHAMNKRFTWTEAAKKYEFVYEKALERRAQWV